MNSIIRIDKTFYKFLKQDYVQLFEYLNNKGIYPDAVDEETKNDIIDIHKYIYSICLWSNEFEISPLNQNIYLYQIRSDAIQSLYLSLLGLKKPVKLLLRGIIEDLLQHIYYFDHKIEYERLEMESNYYRNIKFLWEYLKNQPRMKKIIKETETFSTLKQYHGELSKYVHSSSTKYMDSIIVIDDVYFNKEFFKQYKKEIINISCCVNYLLYVFYKLSVEYESEIYNHIIKFIPNQYKTSLRNM